MLQHAPDVPPLLHIRVALQGALRGWFWSVFSNQCRRRAALTAILVTTDFVLPSHICVPGLPPALLWRSADQRIRRKIVDHFYITVIAFIHLFSLLRRWMPGFLTASRCFAVVQVLQRRPSTGDVFDLLYLDDSSLGAMFPPSPALRASCLLFRGAEASFRFGASSSTSFPAPFAHLGPPAALLYCRDFDSIRSSATPDSRVLIITLMERLATTDLLRYVIG